MNRVFYALLLGVTLLGIFCQFECVEAASDNPSQLVVYPEYDDRIPRCYDYGVTIHQGDESKKLQVYNRCANGEQMSNRCFQPDFNRRFCEFAFTGTVRVDIEVYRDFTSYSILPSAKAYRNEYHDGVISVWLDENDTNFMIRLDDEDATILSVFADAPEEYAYDATDPSVLYVDQKWCDPNGSDLIYTVPEHIKTIYIAPGCVLYSRLLIKTNDVTVCGHGMLVDPYSDYYDTQSIGLDNYKMVIRVEGSNITLRDFKMIDSQNWNIYLYSGYNHTIYDVKILTARITTDAVAVGSGNVEIENCLFYVSDNVFTYNGDRGFHHIKNCLIGTTCAAFFPQHHSSYEIDFTDIYVFRANEGIINNWYNPARIQSDIKHITFDHLDCTDIVHTPWIFNAHDMGDAEKYFTFKNCHFANIRGDSNIASWNTTANQAIYVANNTKGYMHCSGYQLEFMNCTLNGAPITSTDVFYPQLTDGNEITFTIKSDGIPYSQETKKVVNHIYPHKVYVGNYLQPLKYQPFKDNDTTFLPEGEICNALGVKVKSDTKGMIIEDVKYIPLDVVQQNYANTTYDKTRQGIQVTPVNHVKFNLVKDYRYTSRWNPYAYPNVILDSYIDSNQEIVLRCDVNSNTNYPGMFTNITDDLKKNGADVYTISFDAKSVDDMDYKGEIWVSNIIYKDYQEIERKVTGTFTAKKDWTHYEVELDLSKWEISENSLEFIRICSANTPGYDVLFKNIKMEKTSATTEAIEDNPIISKRDVAPTPKPSMEPENQAPSYNIANSVIQLAKKSYTYTGKVLKPQITVQMDGTTLTKGVDYTIVYANNKKIGPAVVKVTGMGNYIGSKTQTFIIHPITPSIKKLSYKKKKIVVRWTTKIKQSVSYQVQFSNKKTFPEKNTVTVKSTKKNGALRKRIKAGKAYYIRVRAYKKVKGKTYRSAWSTPHKLITNGFM